MKTEFHSKNGHEITDSMKEYATKKLTKIENFYNGEIQPLIVIEKQSDHIKTEITIPTKFYPLRGEQKGVNYYETVDLIIDKLERQIKKHKSKVNKSLHNKGGTSKMFKKGTDLKELEKEIVKPHKKIKTITPDEMAPKEAETALEFLNHDFYIFLNSETNKHSVVYKRNSSGDEKYGLINVK